MANKIFVSYKYSDARVNPLKGISGTTTARDYVDKLDEILEEEDHIFKGEDDGEDMSNLQDSTIGSKLGDKIFDSTVTIVLISKGMKENDVAEADQWIPWEISYSLKEQSRENKRSKTNAVLAVVLPDERNLYDYFIVDNSCPYCNSRMLKTDTLFQILKNNMFNIKKPEYIDCDNHIGGKAYKGYSCYIHSVKWIDFCTNPDKYIDIALEIRRNINEYEITKSIK
ncbi:MAG: TIR domain-containing protein [Bacteroidales bacterium]|jgi:hypothetical protein|nr:TIR domain-containing protein [Bacteroidales bacterium]